MTRNWVALMGVMPLMGQAPVPASRPVTVADSIEMNVASSSREGLAYFSPDKSQFVVLTHKGDIPTNSNIYSLWLLKSADAFQSPRSEVIATLSTTTNQPAIRDIRWMDDKTIVFLGAIQPSAKTPIYALNVPTRKVRRIYEFDGSIMAFDATRDLAAVALLLRPAPETYYDPSSGDRGIRIAGQQLADLLANRRQGTDRLIVQRRGRPVQEIPLGEKSIQSNVYFSPDGHRLVVAQRIPANSTVFDQYRIRKDLTVVQYLLIDTDSGASHPLIAAPSLSGGIAWLRDGNSLIISGVYLPPQDGAGSTPVPVTAEVDVKTGSLRSIAEGYAEFLSWNQETASVLLRPRAPSFEALDPVLYQKTGRVWEKKDASAGALSKGPFTVQLEQDMNTPPRLVAVDPAARRSVILDLNPQFSALRFGKVEAIAWKGTDEQESEGGLYLPPNFVVGRKYPLVIQLEGWDAKQFWIDGPSTAGYAAQELAGKGIVVAQLGLPPLAALTTAKEGAVAMAAIEGLIDYLAQRGYIDRARIGLLGWSRTGYHVRYTLTFSKYTIAAAVIVDGMDASYFQYLSWANNGPNAGYTYELINGSRPFGDGLSTWNQHATGFNLEKVHTPVWLLGFRTYSLLNNWEWFVGLQQLEKPVEFTWLPNSEHAPLRPQERLAAQGGTVDWFTFWLSNQQDPDASKADQYARWQQLRRLHEADTRK
jgi:hypothetical protein